MTAVRARLRAIKRAAGNIELAAILAAQAGERACIRGVEPPDEDLAAVERALADCAATLATVGRAWAERAAAALPTTPTSEGCADCAHARAEGAPHGCAVHVAEDVL